MSMQYLLDYVKDHAEIFQTRATALGLGSIDDLDATQTDILIRDFYADIEVYGRVSDEDIDTGIELSTIYAILNWRKNKQVYSFEQEFIDVLVKTPLDFKLESAILNSLPYQTFAIEIGNKYSIINVVKALYMGKETYALTVNSLDNVNFMQAYTTILTVKGDQTIDQLLHTCLKSYDKDSDGIYQITEAVQATLYLAAENAKIVENSYQKTIYKKPNLGSRIKDRYAEIQKWDCGVRVNEFRPKPSLLDAANIGCKVITPTGKTQAPCWRRAHWQTYWTGKGRTIPKLNWKQPYRTHEDEPIPVTKSRVSGSDEM